MFLIPMGQSLTVAIGTVAVLEVVNIKVAPVLEGVNITEAVLKVVVIKVTSTSVAVVTGTRS